MYTRILKCPSYCFRDALDECNEHELDHVLSVLAKCVGSSEKTDIALSICYTSRPNPEIEIRECQSLVLHDENHADIFSFVQT